MIPINLIASLGGLVIPPIFDFIKKKFIKSENDNPSATLNTLATTKPDVMPAYVEGLAKLKDAEVKFFNRDVIGTASKWVVDLRASIRPLFVAVSIIVILSDIVMKIKIDPSLQVFMEATISSWFGSRLCKK